MRALLLTALLLSVLAPAARAAEAMAACHDDGRLQYLCGPTSVEDLVPLPGTRWLIGSGMAEEKTPGHIHLIDLAHRSWEALYPSTGVAIAPDERRFPACKAAPDTAGFGAHGIALRATGHGRYELLVVNHGREAIEFFTVRVVADHPALTWIGCVTMPQDVYLNAVVGLPDGGFLATQFYTPSKGGIRGALSGAVTGRVLEWHAGGAVTPVAGTELSGANGIEISDGGRIIYVAAWGSHELVRFDRHAAALKTLRQATDFAPDNLRWGPDGQLLVAGQRFSVGADGATRLQGWNVARVSPATLALTPLHTADGSPALQGVSVAVQVQDQLWLGSYKADRVGVLTLH